MGKLFEPSRSLPTELKKKFHSLRIESDLVFNKCQLYMSILKNSIDHLPVQKQNELNRIVKIIRRSASVEMIILFGSYSRGDWVEDSYIQDYIVYEYLSDFDILVVVDTAEKESSLNNAWQRIENLIYRDQFIKTPTSIIPESIDFLNQKVYEGHYFYADIYEDGIMLYDSGQFRLNKRASLTKKEKNKITKESFKHWIDKAAEFKRVWKDDINDQRYSMAAFHLHQATESLYAAFLIVHIYYKPKTHNLQKLANRAVQLNIDLGGIFPGKTKREKFLFDILKKAYVDARYKKNYSINKEDLYGLEQRTDLFREKIIQLCQDKITVSLYQNQ